MASATEKAGFGLDQPLRMVSYGLEGEMLRPSQLDDLDWCREFRDRDYPGAPGFDGTTLESILEWEDDFDTPELSLFQEQALSRIREGFRFTQRHWK